MDSSKERICVFRITSGTTPPTFEIQESILNKKTLLIQFFVIFSLNVAVFLWRDYGCIAVRLGIFQNFIGIITFICQQDTNI